MKVLVADDDVHSRRLLEIMLAGEGYEIVSAADGTEVLKILEGAEPPRLVILDWMMPQMDGITTCKEIRKRNSPDYTYIILLTAKTKREDIITGLEAGADDYMVKPFHAQELSVRLRAGARIIELQNKVMDRSKTIEEFVYAVTHDLRTPLIAMDLTMCQARDGIYGDLPADYARVVEKTVVSVKELLRLADTLLIAARFDDDEKAPLLNDSVDLCKLVRDCVAELEPIWRSRGQKVSLIDEQLACTVRGEAQNLRRVLINLLSNATKFTPTDGAIEVSFGRSRTAATISIFNDGQTLSEEEQSKLFQRFTSMSRRSVGAGLGLYLCRRIIESHGGTIMYVAEPDRGSRFQFTLPLERTS